MAAEPTTDDGAAAPDQADLPLLYTFRRCPYAMRARMAIVLGRKIVRVRELVLRDKPAAMLEASPKGTVPVLVLPGGQVIDESLSVMEWAWPEGVWTAEQRALVAQNDGPFKRDLDRYKYPNRYEDVDPDAHRIAGAGVIANLNERIAVGGQLGGAEPGPADYAIFPFIRQFRIADPGWFDAQPWPALHGWLQDHMVSALFLRIMKKYPLWNDEGEEGLLGSGDGAG